MDSSEPASGESTPDERFAGAVAFLALAVVFFGAAAVGVGLAALFVVAFGADFAAVLAGAEPVFLADVGEVAIAFFFEAVEGRGVLLALDADFWAAVVFAVAVFFGAVAVAVFFGAVAFAFCLGAVAAAFFFGAERAADGPFEALGVDFLVADFVVGALALDLLAVAAAFLAAAMLAPPGIRSADSSAPFLRSHGTPRARGVR